RFPTPKWHEKDGGRYIGTGHMVITRDPDTGEVNLGTYRVMLHDAKTVGIHISPGKHGQLHIQNYHARGQPCPIVLSLGQHPLMFLLSTMTVPEGDEYAYIGAIRGKPVEVIEEEITGLPVPADSEILLAGWCPPGKRRAEGPFGEFTGYYAGGVLQAPIIEVERVYFRNNPIMLGSPPGKPPNDTEYPHGIISNVMFENELKRNGISDVKGVCTHEIIGAMFVAISIKQRYAGQARQAGLLAASLPVRGIMAGRYIIVVDDDIDVTNLKEVLWALCTRSDPAKSIEILHNLRSTPLDPMIRKPASLYVQSKAIIDACRPFDWRNEFPEAITISPEMTKTVRQKWSSILDL
ncbi:MAG: ubiD, partial [Dehalococcoidia bacterium]|nr:ubiD [Dehalococcoidia bacterium]